MKNTCEIWHKAGVYKPYRKICEHSDLDIAKDCLIDTAHPELANDLEWKRIDNRYVSKDIGDGFIVSKILAETDSERIELALDLITDFAQIDGSHHKTWVIDQVARILTGDGYDKFVNSYCDGEDGPNTYSWDEGSAP